LAAFRNASVAVDVVQPVTSRRADVAHEFPSELTLTIHKSLGAVEADWRRFEKGADCTPFQTYDWLAAWHRHIGEPAGVQPVVAVGHFDAGDIAFILPLAIKVKRLGRRLGWLGHGTCDYNAPLLARDFWQRVTPDRFVAAWQQLRQRLQSDPALRHDWVQLEQMPEHVGGQVNPFTHLDVELNRSGAHLVRLSDNWEKFYRDRRSSGTRRRDRRKRGHLLECGEIRFVSAEEGDARRTFETLTVQKRRWLARKGIPDIFERPGCREFFLDLISNPKLRQFVHVSRVEVGTACVAANLGLVFGDCYYHILSSYDDGELSRYGCGSLHLRELMAYAIGRGLRRFDFTVGDEPYKLEWSDVALKLYDHASAATWRGWPATFSALMLRRIKRFIKQTPLAWRMVGHMRSAIGLMMYRHETRGSPRPRTRARPRPASWATWICCGRSRSTVSPAPW
jgi:CelD/BcsL family acetyltransferase involved in cellulose biosynthesis